MVPRKMLEMMWKGLEKTTVYSRTITNAAMEQPVENIPQKNTQEEDQDVNITVENKEEQPMEQTPQKSAQQQILEQSIEQKTQKSDSLYFKPLAQYSFIQRKHKLK